MTSIHPRPCFLTPQSIKPNLPLFVFLPGMDGTGQLLRSQLEYLDQAFDVRSLAISPTDLTCWEVLSQAVISLIKSELEGQKRQVYLCGESFGGCLALQVIRRAPYLIDKLILINPASSFQQQSLLYWGSHLVGLLPECIYSYSIGAFVAFLATWERTKLKDLDELKTAIQIVPHRTTVWRLSLLREFQIALAELQQIQQPTLLIGGGADRLLPSLSEVQRLAGFLPNAQVLSLPNSGHACLLEADVNLLKILKTQNFLDDPTRQTEEISAIMP